MRSARTVLIVAGVILVVGVLLGTSSRSVDSYGWFAYAPDESVTLDSAYVLTTRQVIGWAAAWMASLIVTGVAVRHLAPRRRGPRDDQPE